MEKPRRKMKRKRLAEECDDKSSQDNDREKFDMIMKIGLQNQKLLNDIKSHVSASYQPQSSTSKRTIDDLPCKTMEEFQILERKLENENVKQELISDMKIFCDDDDVCESVWHMLNKCISRDIRRNFTYLRKGHMQKVAFSKTFLFETIIEVVIHSCTTERKIVVKEIKSFLKAPAETTRKRMKRKREKNKELTYFGPNWERFSTEEDKILINYLDREVPDIKVLDIEYNFWDCFIPTDLLPGRSPLSIKIRFRELSVALSLSHLEFPESTLQRLGLPCTDKVSRNLDDKQSTSDSLSYCSPPRPSVSSKNKHSRFGTVVPYPSQDLFESPHFALPGSPRSTDSNLTSVSNYIEWTGGMQEHTVSPSASESDNTYISNVPYISWAKESSVMKRLAGSPESDCTSISNLPFIQYAEEIVTSSSESDFSPPASYSEDIIDKDSLWPQPSHLWYSLRRRARHKENKLLERKKQKSAKRNKVNPIDCDPYTLGNSDISSSSIPEVQFTSHSDSQQVQPNVSQMPPQPMDQGTMRPLFNTAQGSLKKETGLAAMVIQNNRPNVNVNYNVPDIVHLINHCTEPTLILLPGNTTLTVPQEPFFNPNEIMHPMQPDDFLPRGPSPNMPSLSGQPNEARHHAPQILPVKVPQEPVPLIEVLSPLPLSSDLPPKLTRKPTTRSKNLLQPTQKKSLPCNPQISPPTEQISSPPQKPKQHHSLRSEKTKIEKKSKAVLQKTSKKRSLRRKTDKDEKS